MTAAIAKAWFREHPRNVVSFHWRWAGLQPSSREFMGLPRDASVRGHRVVFGPHQSELSLVGKYAKVTDSGELELSAEGSHFITYRAV